MRLLAHTIAKFRRGYPLSSFSQKALYLLEGDAKRQFDFELADQIHTELIARLPNV